MPGMIRDLSLQGVRREAGLLPARGALAAAMLHHGLGKLKGEGPSQARQLMAQHGLHPPMFWGLATGVAETMAGLGMLLGLWTRPAALAVLVTQAVAVWKVHRPRGYDIGRRGFEYNLALMAIAAGMLITGPGRLSAHEPLLRRLEGRGLRRWYRRARPTPLLKAVRLVG